MSVNLTGKGTGSARTSSIFLSIYFFFIGKANPMQHTQGYSLWSNLAGEFVAVIANSEPFFFTFHNYFNTYSVVS